jgi:hypothetical protein
MGAGLATGRSAGNAKGPAARSFGCFWVLAVGPSALAISISAVAWISASSSASRPGENSSRRSGEIVIGTPSGMNAVLSSVPSFEGDAPRYSSAAGSCCRR